MCILACLFDLMLIHVLSCCLSFFPSCLLVANLLACFPACFLACLFTGLLPYCLGPFTLNPKLKLKKSAKYLHKIDFWFLIRCFPNFASHTKRKAVVTLQSLSCYHMWQKPKVTNQICAFQRLHPLSLSIMCWYDVSILLSNLYTFYFQGDHVTVW